MNLELEQPIMNANTSAATPTPVNAMNMDALGRQNRHLNMADEDICLETRALNLFYGQKQALFDVNMNIPRKRVTAFIGPSGCGKSTLLRTFNRMNDLVDGCHINGKILLIKELTEKSNKINIAHLSKGLYNAQIQVSGKSVSKKIVVN